MLSEAFSLLIEILMIVFRWHTLTDATGQWPCKIWKRNNHNSFESQFKTEEKKQINCVLTVYSNKWVDSDQSIDLQEIVYVTTSLRFCLSPKFNGKHFKYTKKLTQAIIWSGKAWIVRYNGNFNTRNRWPNFKRHIKHAIGNQQVHLYNGFIENIDTMSNE